MSWSPHTGCGPHVRNDHFMSTEARFSLGQSQPQTNTQHCHVRLLRVLLLSFVEYTLKLSTPWSSGILNGNLWGLFILEAKLVHFSTEKKKCKKCFLVFGIINRGKAYLLFYSESWEETIDNLFQWFWRCGTGLRQDSSAQFYNEPSENWQNVGEGTVRWLSG